MKQATFEKIEVGDKVLVNCSNGTHFASELHGKIVTVSLPCNDQYYPVSPPLAHDSGGAIWLNGLICCSKPEYIKRLWRHKLTFKMPVKDAENLKDNQVFLLVNKDSIHARFIINFTEGTIEKEVPEKERV